MAFSFEVAPPMLTKAQQISCGSVRPVKVDVELTYVLFWHARCLRDSRFTKPFSYRGRAYLTCIRTHHLYLLLAGRLVGVDEALGIELGFCCNCIDLLGCVTPRTYGLALHSLQIVSMRVGSRLMHVALRCCAVINRLVVVATSLLVFFHKLKRIITLKIIRHAFPSNQNYFIP